MTPPNQGAGNNRITGQPKLPHHLPHPRNARIRMQQPGQGGQQPNRPRPVSNHHHPRPRPRSQRGRLLIETPQTRNENSRITTPVRMMRPDELPATALCLTHPNATSPFAPPPATAEC
jgi:hypothetical protein